MTTVSRFLVQVLMEQIGLEEQLCKVIEQQISDIEGGDFVDAKEFLQLTRSALEEHFVPLNQLLDKIELNEERNRVRLVAGNGPLPVGNGHDAAGRTLAETELLRRRVSRILQDDYSALNLITMGNTLLHTTALALECEDVAAVSLQHLKNLAPLVIRLGEMLPEVVARELKAESDKIDLAVAKRALLNTRSAWRSRE